MNFNLDRSFVGIEELKRRHAAQIAEFMEWAAKGDWERFHYSHYDWWTFPIHRHSSYGLKWTVYAGEIAELQKDRLFLERYLTGVQLVSAAWGWDVWNHSYLPDPKAGQNWHNWPVRLYKAAQSVKLFSYEEVFASLRTYALDLMRQKKSMSYNGKDLSWLFTTGVDPYQK